MITLTTISTLPQTTPDELILPPVLIPQLQVATSTPSKSAVTQPILSRSRTKANSQGPYH